MYEMGEVKLAKAVIKKALEDYNSDKEELVEDAARFLWGDGLRYWAAIARLNPEKIREEIYGRLRGPRKEEQEEGN